MKSRMAKSGPFILMGLILLMLAVLNLFYQDHWLDSDMAAEMIFSRLLAEEGHLFAASDWYYSTEFRVLYTQLFMTPLFHFCSDFHVIRTITNFLTYALLIGSYFYMLKPLKVEKKWVALTGTVLLLPFSETMMTHMQMGNTYMPHVILLCFFFGMFLRLVKREEYSAARGWEITAFYAALAVICGVSGVRYLLAMQCPLVLAALLYLMKSEEFKNFREQFGTNENAAGYWKQIWKSEQAPYLYYSILGAVCSVAGYGINVLWVSRRYVFQTYEATNFIAVYQGIFWERVQNALGSLLMLFGYIPDKGFLSLRGLVTMASFVLIALFGYCVARAYRKNRGQRFFVILFLLVSLGLNLFVFVFTTSTMVPRYYITILLFALPVLAFYFEEKEPAWDKLVVGVLFLCCFALSTAKITLSFLTTDKNEDKRAVAAFLEENQYDFGYATYWNANIVTELTDGAVKVANIMDPESLEYFKWSSPMAYYEENYYEGEVFLLLTAEEAAKYQDAEALKQGRQIYEDGKYVVFVYEDVETLMSIRME